MHVKQRINHVEAQIQKMLQIMSLTYGQNMIVMEHNIKTTTEHGFTLALKLVLQEFI